MHVGAGKCGSSALQAYLSRHPFVKADDGTTYEYVCLKDGARLLRGNRCRKAAAASAYGYAASVSVRRWSMPERGKLRDLISNVSTDGRVPIMSFEGWIHEVSLFHEWRILEELGLEARVVTFVRPQVDWINSSWWQWGAWSKEPFSKWLHRWKEKACWGNAARLWQHTPGVQEVSVFTSTEDVVTSFLQSLGVTQRPEGSRENTSLDGDVLRFLQQHRELGADKRQSAVHAMLSRHLTAGPAPAPWVLKQVLVADLIEFYKKDNQDLLALVAGRTRTEIAGDARWWDASAYSGKLAERPGVLRPHAKQVEDIAARALRAILDLDEKMRNR